VSAIQRRAQLNLRAEALAYETGGNGMMSSGVAAASLNKAIASRLATESEESGRKSRAKEAAGGGLRLATDVSRSSTPVEIGSASNSRPTSRAEERWPDTPRPPAGYTKGGGGEEDAASLIQNHTKAVMNLPDRYQGADEVYLKAAPVPAPESDLSSRLEAMKHDTYE
jgi:hypothetical protein